MTDKLAKVIIVFGTRPEAIKMAPVVKQFQNRSDHFRTILCVTGQHRQMLDQVLNIFHLEPDYDLNIMKPEQDLFDIFTGVMLKMRKIYSEVKPDLVIVHGDTSTSTASALAAFYMQIPVAHVEAGLRTYNMYSPWPEEINRQVTSRLATYHFAPTNQSKANLIKENIDERKITVTGNTVIDALRLIKKEIKDSPELSGSIINQINENGYDINRLSDTRRLILITGHRRENFGLGFRNICEAIKVLSVKFPDFDFLYPVHFNPFVRRSVNEILGESANENIFLIDPVDYLPFVFLMQKSFLILTDSGGIQEEGSDLGIPVLVMRDTTERPEALEEGSIGLVGTSQEKIISSVSKLISDEIVYKNMITGLNPYGDGRASERIVEVVLNLIPER
jgi:UDP-N-acetylglucosamine 2-epimerase (non-hydrolysing)